MSNIAFYCTKDHPKYKDTLVILSTLPARLLEQEDFNNYLDNIKYNKTVMFDCILTWYKNEHTSNEYYLAILDRTSNYKKCIYIDYVQNIIAGKQCFTFSYQDALPKAMGLSKLKNAAITVLDATAGLTIDSYAILRLHNNINITLLEQSAIIYSLINDAVNRLALSNNIIHQNLFNRITLYNTDFINYFHNLEHDKFDIVYLDPMFEQHSSAKPKKNMQLLQHICSNPTTVLDMLNTALKIARDRVVLKRANVQPKLLEKKINYSIETKQLRYDIYLAE